jgi:glycosyltransferase involved in cell wall biosynthesis
VRFLFVHQNFPGQYLHIVRYLTDRQHDVAFLSEPNANHMANVRKISYVSPRASDARIHEHAREFELAIRRAEAAATAARQIKALGFQPDIIIGHHGWGELLNMSDVFPGVPILGYFEFFYNLAGQDVDFDPEFPMTESRRPMVRTKNAVNLLALSLPGAEGQSPTQWQLGTYPEWGQKKITLLPEGVDLETCNPAPPRTNRRLALPNGVQLGARDKLVTFVARNLEPYRGFHILLRALPMLQASRPDLHVSFVGFEQQGYGAMPEDGSSWREFLMREMEGKLDLDRTHFLGQVPYDTHVALLRRSDAHVYFSYPFVASWSLREAMATGCAIIGSDTAPVREFITHEQTGLLTPFLEPGKLADSILRVLEEPKLAEQLRHNARTWAEENLDRDAYLTAYARLIERITGQSVEPPAPAARKPAKAKAAAPKPAPRAAPPAKAKARR